MRCFAHATEVSNARLAAPTAKAATPVRVRSKVFIANTKPIPSFAIKFSTGTSTFSKIISFCTEARCPIFIICGFTVTPGAFVGTTIADKLLEPRSGSVCAKIVKYVDTSPLVIKRL